MEQILNAPQATTEAELITHPSNAGICHINPHRVSHHLFTPGPGNAVERHETERRHHLLGDRQPDTGDQLIGHIDAFSKDDFAFTEHLRDTKTVFERKSLFFFLILCFIEVNVMFCAEKVKCLSHCLTM